MTAKKRTASCKYYAGHIGCKLENGHAGEHSSFDASPPQVGTHQIVEVSWQAAEMIDALVGMGLYGKTDAEVMRELIYQRLRDIFREAPPL